MGWTFTSKPYKQSVLQFFKGEFDYSKEGRSLEVVDCAVVGFREAYLAMKRTDPEGKSYTFGMVCLLAYHPKDPQGFTFGYKDMDEGMNPFYYNCPERILHLLSPKEDFPQREHDTSYAWDWRDECWKRLRARKEKPSVKAGTVIRFTTAPIRFVDGSVKDTFQAINPKRGTFNEYDPLTGKKNEYGHYRIRGWRKLNYVVVVPSIPDPLVARVPSIQVRRER